MLKRALRKARYAILLAGAGGAGVFWHQFKRQIYSTVSFVGMERNLGTDSVRIPCRLKYSLQPALAVDMEELLQKARSESRESAHELVQRKWFYDCGFRNCFVARAGDELIAEGRVVRSGRRVSIAEMTVTNQDGKLIAKATGTTIPLEQNPL